MRNFTPPGDPSNPIHPMYSTFFGSAGCLKPCHPSSSLKNQFLMMILMMMMIPPNVDLQRNGKHLSSISPTLFSSKEVTESAKSFETKRVRRDLNKLYGLDTLWIRHLDIDGDACKATKLLGRSRKSCQRKRSLRQQGEGGKN